MTVVSQTTPLQQQTIGDAIANWAQAVSFAQFDPSLGTLVDVRVGIAGDAVGSAWIENLGATAAGVSLYLPTTLEVMSPAGVPMVGATPMPTASVNLGAFDGTMDYAGASGTILAGLTSSATNQATFTPSGADLAAFTGTGTVALSVQGAATSNELGSGNLFSQVAASAGAVVSLQYDYLSPGTVTSGGGGGSSGSFAFVLDMTYSYSPIIGITVTTAAQTASHANATTGWSDSLSFGRFDPGLGTLLSVNLTFNADITGSFAAENLGSSTTTVYGNEGAAETISLPNGGSIVVAPTIAANAGTLGAFDGTEDFAGTSGKALSNLSGTSSGTQQLVDSALLAAFTGTGTIALPITAVGTSQAIGGGNLLTELTQQAGASVAVSYTYVPAGLACFAAGTRIATPDGPVPVEALRVGQHVVCRGAGTAPIVWIGWRDVDCRRHPRPETVWPIRVRAGAFGDSVPSRDLLLSPDHAIYAEGVLIPIRRLVDGDTVVRQQTDTVSYYHVELERHDILLAEDLPVESFLDTGTRSAFTNGGTVIQVAPDFAADAASWIWEARAYAPLVVTGPELERVRASLRTRLPLAA